MTEIHDSDEPVVNSANDEPGASDSDCPSNDEPAERLPTVHRLLGNVS